MHLHFAVAKPVHGEAALQVRHGALHQRGQRAEEAPSPHLGLHGPAPHHEGQRQGGHPLHQEQVGHLSVALFKLFRSISPLMP